MPWFLGNYSWGGSSLFGSFFLLLLWSLVWAGLALWHAARRGDKIWFIIFLFVHTLGILEILYLVFVVKLFSSTAKNPPPKRRKK